MSYRRVIKQHIAIYADPIRVTHGDVLRTNWKQDLWDGHVWIWAATLDGKEGWVPDTLLVHDQGILKSAFDYSAVELSCKVGEIVDLLWEDHGWAWCKSSTGSEGWIPLRALEN